MRILFKIALYCILILALVTAGFSLWFYYCPDNLPDVRSLSRYTPEAVTQVSDSCIGASVALPYDSIGLNLRNALHAAHIREDNPRATSELLRGLVGTNIGYATLSIQISRSMFCDVHSRTLAREFAELRTATQIERQFSRHGIFTIYANRASFAENLIGVQQASQHFFQKNSAQLDISQAALLAGMLQSPNLYSPLKHPDRALQRRNIIIEQMVADGSITSNEAQRAESPPLNIVVK